MSHRCQALCDACRARQVASRATAVAFKCLAPTSPSRSFGPPSAAREKRERTDHRLPQRFHVRRGLRELLVKGIKGQGVQPGFVQGKHDPHLGPRALVLDDLGRFAAQNAIVKHLPQSPPLFPDGERTDRDLTFRVAEMIREKLTLELNQEVPYGIAVEVERLAEEDGQLTVDAAIWVDRAGQKPMVIGAKGERLKRVGRAARLALNELLGRRLHLNLWVKVRENWADNARALRQLGVE